MDKSLFDAVQLELAARLNRKSLATSSSNALLKGLLFDSNGHRMTPVHARKEGVRYRYYQSWVLAQGQKDKAGVVPRVPAQDIEQAVLMALHERFPNQQASDECNRVNIELIERVERIDVLQNILEVVLKPVEQDSNSDKSLSNEVIQFTIPWSKPSNSRKRQIMGQAKATSDHRPMRSETRSRLLKGLAQGRIWLDCLSSSKAETIQSIADRHNLSEKTVRSTLSLAFLSPDIVDAAIEARLPRSLTTTQMLDLPADWQEQRKSLGLV